MRPVDAESGRRAAVWAGVAATDGNLSLLPPMREACNALPVVLLSLGAATLATGWEPRVTAIAGSLPATGSSLLLVIADNIAAPGWVGVTVRSGGPCLADWRRLKRPWP
ncbi:hypothetical protein ACIA47_16010 [Micromonospora sp. NPDC051227]|uniref:hypothetical protein n=1 Tax=Micromonospora sp. NPDC051227 TaxID=3364285 RepID=UPI0037BBB472